jgi:two-component system nitrate/nitrite response regulator NarL
MVLQDGDNGGGQRAPLALVSEYGINGARRRQPTLLIADHAPTRVGIKLALGDAVRVCGEVGGAEQAIRVAKREQPDVCLIGRQIGGEWLAAVRGISRAAPGAAVVVLADVRDADDLLEAVRAGAVGYVPGPLDAGRLRRIIGAIAADEAVIPGSMVIELVRELRAGGARGDELTSRESQVLGMLRRGHNTAAIATRLTIAPVTVRRHISELVRKLGVEDRAALVGPEARWPSAAPTDVSVHGAD